MFHDETSRINYISISDGCQCIATKGGSETAAAAAQRWGSAEEFSYRLSFGTQSSPLVPQAPNWLGVGERMGGFETKQWMGCFWITPYELGPFDYVA